eukprot:GFYU01001813.1.p1 GENE.GFYU01001813.1~~GFYU01001813.1.p1  ORF type:complete len:287 (+),score=57.13 GFYU01001813.1:208-1068(+)
MSVLLQPAQSLFSAGDNFVDSTLKTTKQEINTHVNNKSTNNISEKEPICEPDCNFLSYGDISHVLHRDFIAREPMTQAALLSCALDDAARTPPRTRKRLLKRGLPVGPLYSVFLFNEINSVWPTLDKFDLSEGALKMLNLPNAGGNSKLSEVLSFELLHRLYGFEFQAAEMEVRYYIDYKKTDYTVTMGENTLGVSVTRAVNTSFKFHGVYTVHDAVYLLTKKLSGIEMSTKCAVDQWICQILHIWAPTRQVAECVYHAYLTIPDEIKGNTVVICTVAPDMPWIYW